MVQRGYRALVLWIVWTAAAIIIYLGLYQDSNFFEFIRNDRSRITWVILGLFCAGVIGSFVLTLILTLESTKVDRLELVAKTLGLMGIESEGKRLCVASFFNSLRTIIAHRGDLDLDSLVDVEFSVYRRAAHGLEIIGNLLITLGLIGTVVGLTLTLTGLTGSLEALGHDQDQLLSGLRLAMSGMGTAFYTTLLGAVLGGILLRVYAHIDEHGVESLENALTRICLVYCAADLRPSAEREAKLLENEIGVLNTAVQQLHNTLAHSRQAMSDFIAEIENLRKAEGEDALLEKTLRLRQRYLEMLR